MKRAVPGAILSVLPVSRVKGLYHVAARKNGGVTAYMKRRLYILYSMIGGTFFACIYSINHG